MVYKRISSQPGPMRARFRFGQMTPTTTKWFVIIHVISGETLSNLIV
jgi:hypothetical protein